MKSASGWIRLVVVAAAVAASSLLLVAAGEPVERSQTASPPGPDSQPVEMVYVFSPTCEKCKEASPLVEAAVARYAGRVRLTNLNVLDPDDLDRILDLEDRLHLPESAPPRVIIGERALTGLEEITRSLDETLAAKLPANVATSQSEQEGPQGQPGQRGQQGQRGQPTTRAE